MMATCGTLPHPSDVVRVAQRAVPHLRAGAWLRVLTVEPSTVPGWTRLAVVDDAEHPPTQHDIHVPVAAVTIYPAGQP